MITEVVAALIWDGDRFLACQRPAHKARGLLWEFVGGKTEPGETRQEALIRECREELAVTIRVGEVFMSLIHEYPDLTVRLTLFNATIASGTIQKLEHNDIRWITTAEIDQYPFCPADEEILLRLKTIRTGMQAQLLSMAEEKYKTFQCALMPNVAKSKVLGVRIPMLRKLAKEIASSGACADFLDSLPHKYYEEDNLHGLLICRMQNYEETIAALEHFLPYVDNWATCDLIAPKSFLKSPEKLLTKVKEWIDSDHPYTVRFGIGVLLRYYLDEGFSPELLQIVAKIQSNEYYVNMMIAWYLATALAKQYEYTIPLIEQSVLSKWIHNKTIQKAIESYRITEEKKRYLKTLKRK